MTALPSFCLHRPASLSEAFDPLTNYGDDATIVMGGTELLVLMKLGLAAPEHLVDCRGLPELHGIAEDGGSLLIGAAVTYSEINSHPLVATRLPALQSLVSNIANPRVRNVGTLGGNLCFAEPHSDPATLLISLEATVEIASRQGIREVEMARFFRGPLQTVVEQGEILTRMRIPLPLPGSTVRFERLTFGERPVANIALMTGSAGVRVAVGAVGPVPIRATEAEELLAHEGQDALEEAGQIAAAAARPYTDLEGSSDFKAHLVGVLLSRAFASAS